MKQKRLFVFIILALCATSAWAYDFSAVAPSGQTLFYNITDSYYHRVSVVNPLSGNYYSYVSGDVVIPDSVEYNSTMYAVTSIGNYAFYNCSGLTTPNTYW